MDTIALRPRLTNFVVKSFNANNLLPRKSKEGVRFELSPSAELSLAQPADGNGRILAIVSIWLRGFVAFASTSEDEKAEFSANYEARFFYSPDCSREDVANIFENEAHQYLLVAQTYPLAANHLKISLIAMGFQPDAVPFPLGI